jgi:hypothetical protein
MRETLMSQRRARAREQLKAQEQTRRQVATLSAAFWSLPATLAVVTYCSCNCLQENSTERGQKQRTPAERLETSEQMMMEKATVMVRATMGDAVRARRARLLAGMLIIQARAMS